MSDNYGPFKGKGETVDVVDDRVNQSDTESSEEDSDEPKYKDKQWLYHQYHVLGKSQKDISEVCDVCQDTISYWMQKHGVETRDRGEAISRARDGDRLLRDEDWLRKQYLEREKSTYDIAEDRGVDNKNVSYALDRFDIPRRSKSDALKIVMDRKFGEKQYNNSEWLKHQYLVLGKGAGQIADENGWPKGTVVDALDRHGVQMRSKKAANLLRYKKEKSVSDSDERELVSNTGIDASWRDLKDVEKKEYVPYRDPKWLREKHHNDGLSLTEMADLVDCVRPTITNWMKKHGIETRDGAGSNE